MGFGLGFVDVAGVDIGAGVGANVGANEVGADVVGAEVFAASSGEKPLSAVGLPEYFSQ